MYSHWRNLALEKLEECKEKNKLGGIGLDHIINIFSYDQDSIDDIATLLMNHNLIEKDSIVFATFHIINHYINNTPLDQKHLITIMNKSSVGGLRMPLRFLSRLERYEDANDLLDKMEAVGMKMNVSANRTVASFQNAERIYLEALIKRTNSYINLFEFNPITNKRLIADFSEFLEYTADESNEFCPLKFCNLDQETGKAFMNFSEDIGELDVPDINLYFGSDICIFDKKTIVQLNSGYVPAPLLSPGNPLLWMKKWRFNEPRKEIKQALLLINNGLNENYYHDLLDSIPGLFTAIASTMEGDILIPVREGDLTGYFRELINFLIRFARKYNREIFFLDDPVIIRNAAFLSIERSANYSTQVLKTIFDGPTNTNKTPEKIYISRKNSKNRPLMNEPEVEQLFTKFGFEIVLGEELSMEQQFQLFQNAKVVAGPHGAGLSNVIFGRKCTLIELFSESYMPDCYELIAHEIAGKYYSVVGKSVAGGDGNSWEISIPKVKKLLETLTSRG